MAYRYWELEKIIDGFSYQYAGPDEDAIIIIRENEWANSVGVRFRAPLKDLDSYIKYINERRLEEAIVRVSDLSFLEQCPTLKHLIIKPPIGFEGEYDYSPLYRLPYIRGLWCSAYSGKYEEYINKLDYSKINGLEAIGVQVTSGMKNFEKIPTLKRLDVSDFRGKNRDLTDLFCSEKLEKLDMISCGIKSLKGLSQSKKIEDVSFAYCRSLEDIGALAEVKSTLKHLNIDRCGKIKDFSVLEELENLEVLYLEGNNSIPNLKFLDKLKNLQVFGFDVNVEDGDLSPCLRLPNVICYQGRRHYNLKNKDLPKQPYRGE